MFNICSKDLLSLCLVICINCKYVKVSDNIKYEKLHLKIIAYNIATSIVAHNYHIDYKGRYINMHMLCQYNFKNIIFMYQIVYLYLEQWSLEGEKN